MNRIGISCLLVLCAAAVVAAEPAFHEDFEQNADGWHFGKGTEYPGAEGSFERTTDAAHDGQASARLVGDFTGGGRYVHIMRNFDPPLAASGVSMWVRADNLKQVLVRVRDESGQTHQHYIALKATTDWQQITIQDLARAQQKWGGANDGKWHGRLTQLSVLLEKDGITAEPRKASLLVDDIVITTADGQPAAPQAQAPAQVPDEAPGATAYDFETDTEGWQFSLGGEFKGAKGAMQRTTASAQSGQASLEMSADFTEGGRYVMAWCDTGNVDVQRITFWVRPVDVKKVLFRVTDSTGQTFQHEVEVQPNGQWQQITVNTLRSRNKWGGANDGQWHGPMKQFGILLERPQIVDQKLIASLGIDNVRFITAGEVPQSAVTPFTIPLGRFEDANDGWWHHHDHNIHATLGRDAAGRSGAALHAQVRFDSGNWYTLLRQFDQEFDVRSLSLWVKTDNLKSISVSLLNVTGQSFSKSIDITTPGGWQLVELTDIPTRNAQVNRNDSKLFGAAAAIRVSVDPKNRLDTTQPAQLWIDDAVATLAGEGVFYTPGAAAIASGGIAGTLTMPRSVPVYWQVDDAPAGPVTFRFHNGSDKPVPLPPVELLNHELRSIRTILPGGEAVAPGQVVEKTFALSVPQFGHWSIHTTIDGKPLETRLAWIAEEGRPDVDGPLGIHHHLSQGPWGRGQYIGDGRTVIELTRKLGAGWIREDVRGRFDDNDNLIDTDRHGYFGWPDAAKANGLAVIGTYFDFLNLGRAPRTDGERERFAKRFAQIVNHYKDVVRHFEVWNEPNIEPGWRGQPNPEDYARLIQAAYPAIKQADPEVTVIGVTSAGTDFQYIERVLKAGAATSMDAISVHPYHGVAPELRNDLATPRPEWMGTGDYLTFLERIETLSQLLKRYGADAMPIYGTEMGSGNKDPNVEWRDTCHLIRQFLLGAAVPQLRLQVAYNFQDQGFNEDPASHMTFGLFRADGSPEPRAVAFNTLSRMLYRKRFAAAIDLGEGVWAYRFAGDGGDTLAIWTVDEGRTVAFATSAPQVTVVDLMGVERRITPVNGRMTLAATGAPVFVLDAGQVTPAPPLITLLGPDKATSEDPITFTVQRHGLPAGGALSGDAGRGWTIAASGDAVTFTPDPALRSGRHVLSVRAGDMSAARTIQIDNAITIEAQVLPQGDVVLTAANPFPRVRRLTIKPVAPGRDLKAIELDLPPAGTAEARLTLDLSHAGGMTTIPVTLAASLPSGESGYVTFGQQGETVIAGVTPWQVITPVIDGDLGEWAAMPACVLDQAYQAKPVGRFAKPNWRGPSDLSARFWAGSDATNLYLAVQIRDDHHVQHMADDQMWRGDSVQFATQVEGVRYEFTVGINDDGRVRIRQDSPSKRMLEGATAAARRVDGGWSLELAIPWQQAGISGVTTPPNFSLLINDNDGSHNDGGNNRRGYIEWFSGIGGERKDPEQYGPVTPAGRLSQAEAR